MQDLPPREKHASPAMVFAAVSAALLVIGVAQAKWGWVPILDSVNLAFHEAGHPIFGILGSTLGLYGGTLGQLVFPVAVMVTFRRRADPLGVALGGVWLFENGLNIARYAGDARAQALPLVGGGEHDWFNILSRWDALPHDTAIARTITAISWVGLAAIWIVCLWRWKFPAR